jgi:hypothetical protein
MTLFPVLFIRLYFKFVLEVPIPIYDMTEKGRRETTLGGKECQVGEKKLMEVNMIEVHYMHA